jgi:hypothetical protein
VFPCGAFVKGGVEPVRDFDKSSKERFVQAHDKESGQPVWAVEVIDADPRAKGSVKVKLVAPVQPTLPEPPAGLPFIPIELDGLMVTPYVNSQNNRLAYSLRAGSVHLPGKPAGRPVKDAA